MTFFWLFKKGHCTSYRSKYHPNILIVVYSTAGSPSNLRHGDQQNRDFELQNREFCGFALITTGLRRRKIRPTTSVSFGDVGSPKETQRDFEPLFGDPMSPKEALGGGGGG